jgi:hypothetical protein
MDDNACTSPPSTSTETIFPSDASWTPSIKETILNLSKQKRCSNKRKVNTKKSSVETTLEEIEKRAHKLVSEEDSAVKITNLLLSYVYFLDGPGKNHISCGFHPSTFEPIFAIRSDEGEILLNKIDWYKLFLNLEERNHSNYKINENLNLHIRANFVTFETKEVKIVLSKKDWELFEKLLPLFHKYMIFYICTSSFISSYVKLYVEKCMANGATSSLPLESFFLPEFETPFNINWNRLFYEIPIFCKSKIEKDIFFALFSLNYE